jgi:hypothetical protein
MVAKNMNKEHNWEKDKSTLTFWEEKNVLQTRL